VFYAQGDFLNAQEVILKCVQLFTNAQNTVRKYMAGRIVFMT